jgi:hypothetical protein
MSAVGTSGSGTAAVFRGPTREPARTQLSGSIVGVLECECGERTDELEECWECGAVLCSECARIRMIDGYEVVLCPVCAPALNPRGDE